MFTWIQNMDWAALHWIHGALRCPLLDAAMPWVTALGNGGAVWLLTAAVLMVSHRYRRWGLLLLAALAAGAALGSGALKPLIARARPCWQEPVPMLIGVPQDFSFPSGHTLASATGATVLTAANRRLGWAAIPLAVLIAFSRLYLFVHFPSDVCAGAVLGAAMGAAALGVNRKIERRGAGKAPI